VKPPAERSPDPVSVVTGMRFSATPAETWGGLMFYEEIPRRPTLYLRLLLPRPLRTEGRKLTVGDETWCRYDRGHLLKRVIRIDPQRHYGFAVVAQELSIGGGIRLEGGSYTLHGTPGGATQVELETRYCSSRRPRWLWRPVEAAVCHAFHRHLLRAIRAEVTRRAVLPAAREATSDRP
jgi:hypothetical protein